MTALSLAAPGLNYTVKWNLTKAPGTREAADMGLNEGGEFRLVANYFGNVIVRTAQRQFALNKEVADKIRV